MIPRVAPVVLVDIFNYYLPDFFLDEIGYDVVLNKLKIFQTNKSPGLDRVSGLLLKKATPVIYKHLTKFLNLSLQSGKLPPERKEANVIPLFKGGERSDLNK